MMLWTEGRWPMGHLPFLNPVAVQRIHRCPATPGTSPSRSEVTAKGKTRTTEGHKVRLGLDSAVIKAKTSLVPTTQAEGRVPAHLHTRGRQHTKTQKHSVPALPSSPILCSIPRRSGHLFPHVIVSGYCIDGRA